MTWQWQPSKRYLRHKRAAESNTLGTVLDVVGAYSVNVVVPVVFPQVDLPGIKAKFQEKYQKSLSDMVRSDTSGDFRKLLVALLQ